MTMQPGDPRTVVIERNSTGTIALAILLLVALIGGLILFNQYNASETARSNAIDHTADQVGKAIDHAARKADDAVEQAAKTAKQHL